MTEKITVQEIKFYSIDVGKEICKGVDNNCKEGKLLVKDTSTSFPSS